MSADHQSLVGFQCHLGSCASPFLVPRGSTGPLWDDEDMHRQAFQHSPELYALHAIRNDVLPQQQLRVLFQLLRSPRSTLPSRTRETLDRAVVVLLTMLPADDVLTVFLALRRARINRRHASRFIVRYILNHPRADDLIAHRRPAVRECIEHAIGRNVARGCARTVCGEDRNDVYLRRHLLRFAQRPAAAERALAGLYEGPRLQPARKSRYASFHRRFSPTVKAGDEARPRTVTPTNRGDIAATLVHIYRGGSAPELMAGLESYVAERAEGMPWFDGTVSVVLGSV